MKTFKTKHWVSLPDDLSARLKALVAKPGATQSAIVTDALTAWLDRKCSNELDERFGIRLDRTTRAVARTERKVDAVTEMLAVFVQHQLTLSAHKPPFDDEAGQLGLARYRKYIELVAQRLERQTAPTTAAILKKPTPTPEDE